MNKYSGGNFDDFLKEEGIFEEVTERALRRLLVWQLGDIVKVVIHLKTIFAERTDSEPIRKIKDFQN